MRQRALLRHHQKPLLSFTMNIPGPEKRNDLIEAGFRLGQRLALAQLRAEGFSVLEQEITMDHTGCEGLYVVDAPAPVLKELMLRLEDSRPVARLFDLDVLTPTGEKLSRESLGFTPRPCLICGGPAMVCARSRAHGLEALTKKTTALLRQALNGETAQALGALAVRSLLYEVCTAPKPGLVDRLGPGRHRDMDLFTFMASASALQPYFVRCAEVGLATTGADMEVTFRQLQTLGREAEDTMLRATGGVNTHKGAIFSLGLLCGALGRLPREKWQDPLTVTGECTKIGCHLLRAFRQTGLPTQGRQLFYRTGVTGIRGQAANGFPSVTALGLPTLKEGLSRGLSPEQAGIRALFAITTDTQDTNLLSRGGPEGAAWAADQARQLLTRYPDAIPFRVLEELDREFTRRELSAGGCADLLAVSWLLYLAERETGACHPVPDVSLPPARNE